MSIEPQTPAKTLTQMVATEIRVQMARADVRQSQLAREIGKTEQWLSVRLRGRQPIDVNDLALIAAGLGVGIHDLLPPPEVTAQSLVINTNPRPARQVTPKRTRPQDNRPTGRGSGATPPTVHRTALVERPRRPKRG